MGNENDIRDMEDMEGLEYVDSGLEYMEDMEGLEDIEVDYDLNPTDLYTCICACDWDNALVALERNPIESKTWVVKSDPCSDDDDAVRFLPLHSACARQPPLDIVISLLTAYSEASSIIDDNGMYPLHYACANQASAEIIELLLLHHPDANTYRVELNGSLPIHLAAQWGVSSPAVMPVLLEHNKSLACARDNDGFSPLELAMNTDDYEFSEEVIEILHSTFEEEAMNDSDDSTISTRYSVNEKFEKKGKRNLVKELEEMREVVIGLRERKASVKSSVDKQIALEWEAVNMVISLMRLQVDEKSRERVTSPSTDLYVEEHDQTGMEDTREVGNTSAISELNVSTSKSNIKVEEVAHEELPSIDECKARMTLAKRVTNISTRLTNKAWLSNWRMQSDSKSHESSVGGDKYTNCFDSDDEEGKTKDGDCNDEETFHSTFSDDMDSAKSKEDENKQSQSLEEEEIAKQEAVRIAEAKAARNVKAARNAEAKEEEARIGKVKAEKLRVQKEMALKEKRLKELQDQYEAMQREISHCIRRRDAYNTKVDIVKETITALNIEVLQALAYQNETKTKLEVIETDIKANNAVRRKHIKKMLREVESEPELLYKTTGADALIKREWKATRIMDQIVSDLKNA